MPFTILFIDDDADIRATACELLASDGHHVLATADGEEGLTFACTHRPDLILLDYHMPGMNGLAIVQQLKADDETGPRASGSFPSRSYPQSSCASSWSSCT
jgi:CheY-like chemotaxis protein